MQSVTVERQPTFAAMPGGRGTRRHAIRIPDELWRAALATAKERDEDVASVIRQALEQYVKRNSKS